MTEKKQTEVVLDQITVLKDQVELYLQIFDSIQNGIIITDPSGYITYLNRSYGRFLNLDPDEQIGKHCSAVIENSRMHIVGKTGRAELNQIQRLRGVNIVVEGIPVRKAGRVIAVFGRVMFDDVRVIAATNRNLETMMHEKTFRSDLFYRLNVIPLHVPPLRERNSDILLLSDALLAKIAGQTNKLDIKLGKKAGKSLSGYHWPGNIRELANIIQRAVANLDGDTIHARNLGIHRSMLYRKLKKYNILPA
ncbi:MAG: sigma 54-interacting transcriptional regulator [Desulfobacterium sp.]|nr:sigma 54-interacting transcriptional regulator [Desulfobacterium sp.]